LYRLDFDECCKLPIAHFSPVLSAVEGFTPGMSQIDARVTAGFLLILNHEITRQKARSRHRRTQINTNYLTADFTEIYLFYLLLIEYDITYCVI